MAKKLSQKDHAELIDQHIYQREQLLKNKVNKLSVSLYDKIVVEYLSKLKQADGKIVHDSENISFVQGLNKIYDTFNRKENVPVIKSFIDDAAGLTDVNANYFEVVSDKPVSNAAKIARQQTYDSLGVNYNGGLVRGGFTEKFVQDKTVLKEIKRTTIRAITQGKGFIQLKNELKETIEGVSGKPLSGGLQQYYRNYAYDTLMNVDRQNAQTFADELGLRYFYWSGGVITTSRPLCKLANGKIFDSFELKKLNYQTLNPNLRDGLSPDWEPLKHLGYHACRHRKNYISDEAAGRNKDKWFNINSISTKEITAPKKAIVLNKAQK